MSGTGQRPLVRDDFATLVGRFLGIYEYLESTQPYPTFHALVQQAANAQSYRR